MSNSTIKFYKSAVMLPERNAIFDEMNEEVLGEVAYQLLDFQYQRIELLKTIKVSLQQKNAYYNDYNVVSIKNSDDPRTYYYFITGSKQTAQNTVQFDLLLDVLNSYKIGTDFAFTDRTKLIREHKDRFFDSTTPISRTATDLRTMKVDKEPEGLGDANKQKYTELVMNDDTTALNQKWYLAYVSDSTDEKSPMKVELYPEMNNTIRLGNTGVYRFTADTMQTGVVYYFYNINSYNQGAVVQCSQFSALLDGTIDNNSYYGFACAKYTDHMRVNKISYQNGAFTVGNGIDLGTDEDITIRPINNLARFWTIPGEENQNIETDTGKIMNIGTEVRITTGGTVAYATAISSVDRTSPLL